MMMMMMMVMMMMVMMMVMMMMMMMMTEMSVYLSVTFGSDVTHHQSCDVSHLRHMKTSSMMSRTLRDDVITSCDIYMSFTSHDDVIDDAMYIT